MGSIIQTGQRKLYFENKSKEMIEGITDRLRKLREETGYSQRDFYDFLFDDFNNGTKDDTKDKPPKQKGKEIYEIEHGIGVDLSKRDDDPSEMGLNIALLCRYSEKCGKSLDYIITGKEYQPSAPTCPPEGKDASPAGDNVVESQTEKEPSAEMGSANLPPEESDKTTTDDDLHYSPYDILKAFESLSCIADLKIDSLSTDEGRLGNEGLRIDIRPKEIILPVLQDESKLSLFINLPVSPSNHLDEVDFLKKNRGIVNDGFTYCYLRRIDNERIPASAYALHIIDTRLNDILNLIKSAIGITLSGDTVEFPDFILDTIDKNPIDLSLNHGIPSSDFLNMSEMSHYDEIITTQLEPFRTFVKRANKELSSKLQDDE